MGATAEPEELAARVRAALAYAHKAEVIAAATSILQDLDLDHSRPTVQRIRSGTWFAGKPQALIESVLLAFGRACGVPDYFMLEGWQPPEDRDELERRIEDLERWRDEAARQRPA